MKLKLEDVTPIKVKKLSNSDLYALRLRAIQLHEKYQEMEKKESLVDIDWDGFFKHYKLLVGELNMRNLNFTKRNMDKILEMEKRFEIKVLSTSRKPFSLLVHIGKNNVLIDPVIAKEDIPEEINAIIVTQENEKYWEKLQHYPKNIPVYTIGKILDKLSFVKEKHLFMKALKIGESGVTMRSIKAIHKDDNVAIGVKIEKKNVKISILPTEFLSLPNASEDLIEETIWICGGISDYEKDNNEMGRLSFLSLIELANKLKPKKIFIANLEESMLTKYKEKIEEELKKWQGRILYDGDMLGEKELSKGLNWELSEAKYKASSLEELASITQFKEKEAVIEIDFNGTRAKVEKEGEEIIILTKPENSSLKIEELPLQVEELKSYRDDFVGDAKLCLIDENSNKCLDKSNGLTTEINKQVHIFIFDLLELNNRDISKKSLSKRKEILSKFKDTKHIHFVRPVTGLEKKSLSYFIDLANREGIKKVLERFDNINSEGQFYPQFIAEGVMIKLCEAPYQYPESSFWAKVSISKPETTEAYHHIPVRDAGEFVPDSFRTITMSETKGIKAVIGKLKSDPNGPTKIQKYLFDVKKWTMAEAKAWIKEQTTKKLEKILGKNKEPNIKEFEKLIEEVPEASFDFKKVDETEYIVGGIVYRSGKIDAQGHYAMEPEVWDALKKYMIEKKNIKVMHKGQVRHIPIVENYFVEERHHKGGTSEDFVLEKGDWWLSVYLGDKENRDIWNDVKLKKLNGFSMAGMAQQRSSNFTEE